MTSDIFVLPTCSIVNITYIYRLSQRFTAQLCRLFVS